MFNSSYKTIVRRLVGRSRLQTPPIQPQPVADGTKLVERSMGIIARGERLERDHGEADRALSERLFYPGHQSPAQSLPRQFGLGDHLLTHPIPTTD